MHSCKMAKLVNFSAIFVQGLGFSTVSTFENVGDCQVFQLCTGFVYFASCAHICGI
jgi:hypothetical protein